VHNEKQKIDLIFHKIEITYTFTIFVGNELPNMKFSRNPAKADLILKFLHGAGNCHGTFSMITICIPTVRLTFLSAPLYKKSSPGIYRSLMQHTPNPEIFPVPSSPILFDPLKEQTPIQF